MSRFTLPLNVKSGNSGQLFLLDKQMKKKNKEKKWLLVIKNKEVKRWKKFKNYEEEMWELYISILLFKY